MQIITDLPPEFNSRPIDVISDRMQARSQVGRGPDPLLTTGNRQLHPLIAESPLIHRAPGKLYRWALPAGTWCARTGLGSLTTEVTSNRYPVLSRSCEVCCGKRKLLVPRSITKRSQT